jgi:hypothetical protein
LAGSSFQTATKAILDAARQGMATRLLDTSACCCFCCCCFCAGVACHGNIDINDGIAGPHFTSPLVFNNAHHSGAWPIRWLACFEHELVLLLAVILGALAF